MMLGEKDEIGASGIIHICNLLLFGDDFIIWKIRRFPISKSRSMIKL